MKKILCFLTAIVLISCSKEDYISTNPPGFLKQMTISDITGSRTYQYAYNGGRLQYVFSEDGYDQITYSGNLITQIEQYDNASNLLSRRVFQYEITNRLVSAVSLNYVSEIGSRQEMTYNSDQTVEVNTYSGNLTVQGTLSSTEVHYFTNGELTKTVTNPGVNETVADYAYDDKLSPFKNITGLDKLILVDIGMASLSPLYIKGVVHNRLGSVYSVNGSMTSQIHYLGTYNAAGFATVLEPDYGATTPTDMEQFTFSYY